MLEVRLAAAVVSVLLAGPFQYIVPVQGHTGPLAPGVWHAKVVVVNPGDEQLTLILEDIYPLNGQSVCPFERREVFIPPRGAAHILATSCGIRSLQALRFTTERPVIPTNEVTSLAACGGPETIPVETSWFPAGADVLIPRVDFRPSVTRANLLLINPNDEPLVVTYERFAIDEQIEYDVLVPPRSLIIHPVTTADFICRSGGAIGEPAPDQTCGIAVRATGMFYAGASVIQNATNDAVYRRGTALGENSEE